MSGRKNRMTKRKSGIYLNAEQTRSKNTKVVSADMRTDKTRRDRVDELIRQSFKKND